MKVPESIRQKLMSAYHNYTSEPDKGFPIWDTELTLWLTDKFGLQTDSPEYDINLSFTVFFDWNIQVWRVK